MIGITKRSRTSKHKRHMTDQQVLVLLRMGGWLAAAIGLGFLAYIVYAIATGTVVLSGRYSEATFAFERNPGAFLFALSIYAMGCGGSAWAGKVLLREKKKPS
jgi:hypothetical protein